MRSQRMFYSIRWRFAIIYLLLIAVVFGIVFVAVSGVVQDNLLAQRIKGLKKNVDDIAVQAAPYVVQSDANELYSLASEGGSELGGRMLVISNSGIVLADSFSMLNGVKVTQNEVNDILHNQSSSSYGYHKIDSPMEEDSFIWTLNSTSSINSEGETVGVLLLSTDLQDVIKQIDDLGLRMLFIFIISCAIIIIVSMFVSRWITQPVQELTATALKISSGDLESRANIKGKNELAELGQTFNMMVGRLQNIDQQRSEFVSDASHELKTPLASMKILVESLLYQEDVDPAIQKEFLTDINNEVDRLSNLITDLLLISEMDDEESEVTLRKENLTEIVQMSISAIRPIAEVRNISIQLYVLENIMIDCDATKLRQAVNNLLDNAVKYSSQNGRVDVTIRRVGSEVRLAIQDQGMGMSENHLDHIFERFYRVDKARARGTGGTGLGLHIVRKIALMHGGRVEVSSQEDRGSTFTLVLPIERKALTDPQKQERKQ